MAFCCWGLLCWGLFECELQLAFVEAVGYLGKVDFDKGSHVIYRCCVDSSRFGQLVAYFFTVWLEQYGCRLLYGFIFIPPNISLRNFKVVPFFPFQAKSFSGLKSEFKAGRTAEEYLFTPSVVILHFVYLLPWVVVQE
jgi:hypothetical protein